jgi:hypothetical protein
LKPCWDRLRGIAGSALSFVVWCVSGPSSASELAGSTEHSGAAASPEAVLLGISAAAAYVARDHPEGRPRASFGADFRHGFLASFWDSPEFAEDWPKDDWDWVDRAAAAPTEKKSLLTAVGASALLPGLGEQYVGRSERAKIFYFLEGALWTTFAFYRIQGDLRRDRYIEFAGLQAGAPRDGDADYYEHIGDWLSLEEWHSVVRQDARFRFPDDALAQQDFFEQNKRYDEGEFWEWPDDETRTRFRQLRSRSERSFRNARLAVGAAIVDRLASIIDALSLARRYNRRLEEERASLSLRVAPRVTTEGLVVGPILSARY